VAEIPINCGNAASLIWSWNPAARYKSYKQSHTRVCTRHADTQTRRHTHT